MTPSTLQQIEYLVDNYLSEYSGSDRVVFHCQINISDDRADYVHGDIVYHDLPIEGGVYFPHTNIHKYVYQNNADLTYVPAVDNDNHYVSHQPLSISNHSIFECSVEDDELGEWEFECFLTQISKEECGQYLFEAYGSKEGINFLSYPEKLHFFIEDAFETYLKFEEILSNTMKKYDFT
jgi:hypothetical protein